MADKIRKRKGGKKGLRSARDKSSGKYSKQRIRTEVNRKRRRLRHLAFHPNDLQTLALMKKQIG